MTKPKWCLLAVSLAFLVAGCAHNEHKHTSYVRNGTLKDGLHPQAFLDVWGSPDRTTVVESQNDITAEWGPGGGYFRKGGKWHGEIWHYDKLEVKLMFSGQKLVDYKTKKTTLDLRSFAKPKPAE